MSKDSVKTKILFIDSDENSFEFRKCMASVLTTLPPVELYHALDATEALGLLEAIAPDVVVIDGDFSEEAELFLDSLSSNHPPIVLQTNASVIGRLRVEEELITRIEKNESVDGIHRMLKIASDIGLKSIENRHLQVYH